MRLWIVLWPVGENARLIDVKDLRSEVFERPVDDLQLFLGSADLRADPAWRSVNGRRLLDFPQSYAVQLVPSIFISDRNMLLQGRVAILQQDQYEDAALAKELARLFRRLKSEMKRASDGHRVVVQVLSSGEKKSWRSMLVGKELADADMELKQFPDGTVRFAVEKA
jgi:hypothetical protein